MVICKANIGNKEGRPDMQNENDVVILEQLARLMRGVINRVRA